MSVSEPETKVNFLDDLRDEKNHVSLLNSKSETTLSTLKKSFADRWFSKIQANSLRGSIFNLSILLLGTGCLALPNKMSLMSLTAGLIAIVCTGFASYMTLYFLTFCSVKENIFDYTFLVKKIYGKSLGKVLDASLSLFIFGQICLYQVISNNKRFN